MTSQTESFKSIFEHTKKIKNINILSEKDSVDQTCSEIKEFLELNGREVKLYDTDNNTLPSLSEGNDIVINMDDNISSEKGIKYHLDINLRSTNRKFIILVSSTKLDGQITMKTLNIN